MAVHIVRRRLAFARERIFDLVLDVERYPRFLPGWLAARVRERRHGSYRTEQVVQFRLIRQHFMSRTTYVRPERIEVRTDPGAILRRFDLDWEFHACGADICDVAVTCHLDLKVGALQRLGDALACDLIESLVQAFHHEAARQFGHGPHAPAATGPGPHSHPALPPGWQRMGNPRPGGGGHHGSPPTKPGIVR